MDHVVYLDHKAKEFENLISGKKTMIIRGAMGRKLPHGRVFVGDVLYFIRNNGEGQVKAKARVKTVFHSDKLSREASIALVEEHQDHLLLDARLFKRFAGKRYLVLITLSEITTMDPYSIDRSGYKTMDDWLPVENIHSVVITDSAP